MQGPKRQVRWLPNNEVAGQASLTTSNFLPPQNWSSKVFSFRFAVDITRRVTGEAWDHGLGIGSDRLARVQEARNERGDEKGDCGMNNQLASAISCTCPSPAV